MCVLKSAAHRDESRAWNVSKKKWNVSKNPLFTSVVERLKETSVHLSNRGEPFLTQEDSNTVSDAGRPRGSWECVCFGSNAAVVFGHSGIPPQASVVKLSGWFVYSCKLKFFGAAPPPPFDFFSVMCENVRM